jgi:hypothetical protein
VSARIDQPLPECWGELVAAALDGTISGPDRDRLDALVASDPRCARDLARAALLHDAISRELTAGEQGRGAARMEAWTRIGRRLAVAAVLAVAAGAALWAGLSSRAAVAADTELARLASATAGARRVYRITATEPEHPADRRGTERRPAGRGARARPSIDGATLSLGARGAYVLERTDADGSRVVSGSDGASSWIVPARGPVRVSGNPGRFRGGLPGEQHELPFFDPADGIDELRAGYSVSLGAERVRDGLRIRTLIAHRRPDVPRGPRDVVIEYDADTALVHRMHLDRLPQAGGGPRAVTLELTDQSPLDASYFAHEAHHDPGRSVARDD